ncbi:MAG: helix-turn-helix transcriptional regulator [Alistipes sp.]|nr:helix-turn-helix transcriptional regulator [Alistipes sp.]
MKAKLQHLIKSEGLTASRFAEMLEIQPAGVSHILAGRNKPSFDLLQKILRRFPKINPDWLLLDSEQMYREGWNEAGIPMDGATTANTVGGSGSSGMPVGSLFGEASGSANFSGGATPSGGAGGGVNVGAGNLGGVGGAASSRGASGGTNGVAGNFGGASRGMNGGQALGTQNLSRGEANISAGQGVGAALSQSHAGLPITKIVIFYADGTFEAYSHGF